MKNYIEWDNAYSIGILQIDNQHRQLIDLINQLESICKTDNKNIGNEFIEVMKQSTEYVLVHFRDEEKLMNSIKYKNLVEHKALHEQFIKKIYEITKCFNNGNEDVYQHYFRFLKDWLLNHIATHDKLIGIAYHNQK